MSYDMYLVDKKTGETVKLETPEHFGGGMYALGGSKEMYFNVTYNYSDLFELAFGVGGIKVLEGVRAVDSIPLIAEGLKKLPGSDGPDDDYWQPTPGNVRLAMATMIRMAAMAPDAVWKIT
jgi:hypothetical protein